MTFERFLRFSIVPILSTALSSAQTSVPQPTLEQVFAQLHSADPAIVDAAKESVVEALNVSFLTSNGTRPLSARR